jgi:hypothetical protein
VGLGYSPFHAGMLMIPVAIATIVAKSLALPVIQRFSYRRVLIWNTFFVGTAVMSFLLVSKQYPLTVLVSQLAFFGVTSSLQFTAMNTVTLKDVPALLASSGNSLYSMVQMLSMSFGVAAAGALVSTFNGRLPGGQALGAFHATFFCMGLITCTSAAIFWQLSPAESLGRAGWAS